MRHAFGRWLVATSAVALMAACLPRPAPDSGGPGLNPVDEGSSGPGGRAAAARMSADLAARAETLSQSSYDHFRGRDGRITDEEQSILFKSEEFAAASRLFARLAGESSDFFRPDTVRTNLYNALLYLAASFRQLDGAMDLRRLQPSGLIECRRLLSRLEREFAAWPEGESLPALEGKYVKARDATVYLVEREGAGRYIRRPFKNLESLFKYNFDRRRGRNPWDHFVEIREETLAKMSRGRMIDQTFDGQMVMEPNAAKGSTIYLIERGTKRGLTRVDLVSRYGGWGKVYEIPRDIIAAYPDGEPIR
jgi:hypothetical protein